MKRIFYTIIALLTSLCASATEPLVSESKEWYHAVDVYLYGKYDSRTNYAPMVFEGTTEIDGIVYHNLVNKDRPEEVLAHIRQEGAKTFIRLDDCPYVNHRNSLMKAEKLQEILNDYDELLLFDFEAKPGDKYLGYACDLNEWWSVDNVTVIDVEDIELNGETVKKQTISFPVVGGWHNLEVIEGIGCINGCFFAPFTTVTYNDFQDEETLLTCVKDRSTGAVLYGQDPELYGYQPLIREGVVWQYKAMELSDSYDIKFTFDGTETVSDTIYHRLINVDTNERIALMREEGKKVYFRKTDEYWELIGESPLFIGGPEDVSEEEIEKFNSSPEILIYDFSAQKGDSYLSWSMGDGPSISVEGMLTKITDTGTITLNDGEDYMYQKIGSQNNKYIEGIGTTEGVLPLPQNGPYITGINSLNIFLEFVYDRSTGEVLYQDEGYSKLIREDRVWEYSTYGSSRFGANGFGSLNKYKFDGTVEKYGKTYHQFKNISNSNWDYEIVADGDGQYRAEYTNISEDVPCDRVDALMREEDGKVYALIADSHIICGGYGIYDPETHEVIPQEEIDASTEVLLYDFSTPAGYKYVGIGHDGTDLGLEQSYQTPMTIIEDKYIDNVVDNSAYKWREITVQNDFLYYTLTESDWMIDLSEPERYQNKYVEGIGNVSMGNMTLLYCEPYLYTTGQFYMPEIALNNVYDESGNIIFKGEDMKVPRSGISSVEADGRFDDRMYDLMGREIRNPLPGTVYIQRGRKFVAR